MITLHHVEGFSAIDHYGPEIIRAAGKTNGTMREARAAVQSAAQGLPKSALDSGLPRIDAESENGKRRRLV
jgi:hypothetical protein